jgi:hypothetical protein
MIRFIMTGIIHIRITDLTIPTGVAIIPTTVLSAITAITRGIQVICTPRHIITMIITS